MLASSYLFGTLIALLKNGRPILGVIHQPIVRDLFLGNGTGRPVAQRPACVGQPLPAGGGGCSAHVGSLEHLDYQNGPAFESLSKRVLRYRTWGDCHGYHLVATGGAHIMTDPIINKWDFMALIPIIHGAGGRITNWQGDDPLAGSGIVATCGTIHDEVIRLLNP